MSTFYATNDYRSYLAHHGIRGMKWGVRRFQNADGSYTSAGKSRYGVGDGNSYNGVKSVKGGLHRFATTNYDPNARAYEKRGYRTPEEIAARNERIKKVALAVAGTAAVTAGAYAAHKYMNRSMDEAVQIAADLTTSGKTTAFSRMTSYDNISSQYASEAERAFSRGNKDLGKFYSSQRQAYSGRAAEASRNYNAYKNRYDNFVHNESAMKKARNAIIKRDVSNMRDRAAEELSRFGKPGVGRFAERDKYTQQAIRDARKRTNASAAVDAINRTLHNQPSTRRRK